MRRRFFVDRFEPNSANLRGDAAEHLGRVLRAEPGQLYELSDGQSVWLAKIERLALSKRGENRIEFSLVEPVAASEPSPNIDLLIAVVKFDRFEWCLEKATELGVTDIIPLAAARSDKPLISAASKRQERWKRILLESAQQSRRLRVPALHGAAMPEKAFSESSSALKIILSERSGAQPFRNALSPVPQADSVSLAIGPEGGWKDEEFAAATRSGFIEASLGQNILRTETAVLASMAVLRYTLSD
jgi:16S rRNA (uracil1498-N3)-methyltransferase